MDIYSIKENLPAIEEIGYTLDAPERMLLEMGLIKLTDLANSDQLLFWGKIITTGTPYYIAIGIDFKDQYAFPHKKFFYSTGNFEFVEFPALDILNQDEVDNFLSKPFSGNPAFELKERAEGDEGQGQENKEQQQEENNDDSSEEERVKIVPKVFTELDRLNFIVRAIEIECQVFPIGGYRMSEKHEIRYNEGFHGLTQSEAKLNKFQYFRYPQSQKSIEKLERAETVFALDFLEPIENESEWSVQQNITREFVTVRNLVWPGYVGYHYFGSKKFGGVYFGNGIKNVDVAFYV